MSVLVRSYEARKFFAIKKSTRLASAVARLLAATHISMEWPDLARRRAPVRKCALPEPRPSKKARLARRHWLMKLAMLFEKIDFPEVIETLIGAFLLQPRHLAFRKRYGENLRTLDSGRQRWLSGWHPKIGHDTIARWSWFVYHRIQRSPDTDVTFEMLQALRGKRVIVQYRTRSHTQHMTHEIQRPHDIWIVHIGPHSMRVEVGLFGTVSYTLSYSGSMSIELYADYPR